MPVLKSSRYRGASRKPCQGRHIKRRIIMSIKDLKLMRKEYQQYSSAKNWEASIYNFMTEVINTFEALSNALAKKEDAIDVNDIKEVKNING